ncbi:hypothetical protein DRO35_04645 [Candidatus Bathyarchaeota archaeon]|nr:MAG: hypothetical protein DRO35_04645 [Candidatus Bathyarchaeota archaeon]
MSLKVAYKPYQVNGMILGDVAFVEFQYSPCGCQPLTYPQNIQFSRNARSFMFSSSAATGSLKIPPMPILNIIIIKK